MSQASLKQRITRRKVDLLFENVLISQGFSMTNASFLTLLLYSERPRPMLLWWLLAMLASVVRLCVVAVFRRRRDALDDRIWLRVKGAAALLSGAIWGYGATIMLSSGNEWMIIVAAITISGMAAGAVPLLSAQIEIYALYSSALLAPTLFTIILLPPSQYTWAMAAMAGFFWLTLISSARRFSSALINEIEREAELAEARDHALEASRAKSAFLANMSHEIRTPMNGLLGIAEVMRSGVLDPGQSELLDILDKSGRSMMEVLNQILDFTELEAGRHQISQVRCAPAAILRTVVQMFAAAAHLKGLELRCEIAAGLPDAIWSAPKEIANILTVLIGNAVKFTLAGTIDTALWCDRIEGRLTLYVSVTDTGPGIPAAAQSTIFEAFTQVDDSTSRVHGGVGLGLAIARRTAQVMGGNISLESRIGHGSRFLLAVPVGG